jgi:hypothetical protein
VEPLAEAFCRVHELHYQTKAREGGLHENYHTKWPTGWKTEWFYVKIDEKKEKLVQSLLELTFGLTRASVQHDARGIMPRCYGRI